MPAAGGTQSLIRWVGVDRSLGIVLTGRRLDAAEARTAGILQELVEDPHGRAVEIAARWIGLYRSLLAAAVRQLRPDPLNPLHRPRTSLETR